MNKSLQPLIFLSILLIAALSACVRPPAPLQDQPSPVNPSQNQVKQEEPQPTKAMTVETGTAAQANIAVSNGLPQNYDLTQLAGSFQFTEGPAVDSAGNVYFSDINAGRIYKWTTDGNVNVFLDGLNHPNGLMFDKSGNLIACEGGNGRLISIDSQGQSTVLVDQFNGTRFNEPNDLWVDPQGGIYFTDPVFQSPVAQDGQHVYYLSPDHVTVMRVINDMIQPNGLVGTPDGKLLYVADYGKGQTFAYDINRDGTLANKRLFASTGSDGMDLDAGGNLYLTTPNMVQIYDVRGNHLQDLSIPQETPTNIAFAGADHQTLFITARTMLYIAQIPAQSQTSPEDPGTTSSTFTLTSPDIGSDGRLPIEYTCDGASSTLALTWSGAPVNTQGYAVIMHHIAPDNAIHWYWVVYDIPSDVTNFSRNVTGCGILGPNSVNDRNEYAPPCSKGPGDKEYIYTVYALSTQPQITTSPVTRAVLLDAIKDITLASAEMHVIYARP